MNKNHHLSDTKGPRPLGVTIESCYTRIRSDKVQQFKDKVRRITRRNSPVNLEQVIKDLNPVLRGFANSLRVAHCCKQFQELARWVRRRLRAKQLALWRKPQRLHRRLRQLRLSKRVQGDQDAIVA
ncbi:group II intron maturase-specific domain-containing protein [Syntrophotalea acetylenica]|uniref:group II intron maturase-specific domain-containing protein n=1 Tax=Syntrophotalea acetylenica TaxID=29542 RepID=UPI0009300468